ncbi:Type I secretion membrane fusion protein, HlyD family [Candidatus Propionivibrio aalborgensis]|uniref:Membrane fusion protein (MFP) family protein n=1 Tax=Candidatus Propionivibrio aalborgensis TaxID=1860101 RepID=A0A1A8XW89_9RHOO|nr:HlyD family type I secretion periplasmic adaptor subunit [Candidatus Propionivibrio aalborgensis]SBT09279.1 Type I secretion membrane fusion protein, HlyD family [Candidatus Propionivibrio aalborgensis]
MKLPTFNFAAAEPDYHDFSPPLLRLQETSPNPLGRKVLWTLLALLAALLLWALIGQLDIVAVAEGKLIPQSYLKIVQPADAGIVKEILVREGETVRPGQVLMRMDTLISEADTKAIDAEYQRKRLTLRRIDAELAGEAFAAEAGDPPTLAGEVAAQYRANRNALEAALAEERSQLAKFRADLASAQQIKTKLTETLPHYRAQDKAFEKLAQDGFAGSLMADDKKRERIEKEQELKTQGHLIESARAEMNQSEKKLAQIESDYQRQLYAERNEIQGAFDRLAQEVAKQAHRQELLELKATQASVVKDLATHSAGTVVQPGTVLLTLVPKEETLRAEVWVSNEDIGFVRQGQPVKLKFAAFPFQKYGMVDGTVEHVSADSADNATGNGNNPNDKAPARTPMLFYKALVTLKAMHLSLDEQNFALSAGMQTHAEILLGTRTVMEYLLSPVRKAWHEAGRER